MKGHTVPWAWVPSLIQAILALALTLFVVKRTYRDFNMVRRWWPWLSAVVTVLLTPSLTAWLGFGPQGIVAKTMAAELQSLATALPWLMQVVSALQSISTKGMGLKTAGVLFFAGLSFGRVALVGLHRQLALMGFINVPSNVPQQETISLNVQLPVNSQTPPQGQRQDRSTQNGQQQNDQRHEHHE